MSEPADYTSTNWVPSHDFKDARAAYPSSVVDRSYGKAVAAGVTARDLVPKTEISIDTPTLAVVCDVTGSMGTWPAVMFSKLPYLLHELKSYLGADAKFLVSAVGDVDGDKYPLQVYPPEATFDKTKESLTSLVIEGGGGGQTCESYEVAAAFFLAGIRVARDQKPVLVFIGDESPYDKVRASHLAPFGVTIENQSTETLFAELNNVYDVYLIHKPYGHDDVNSPTTARVKRDWTKLLPPEHLIPLDQPERVVDVLFGILAWTSGKADVFTKELTDRQTADQSRKVLTSLNGLYQNAPKVAGSGKSTFHKLPAGKPSKPLL